MATTPKKIDKAHGFMQSIIKNQVLRDEYDKEQKMLLISKDADAPASMKNEKLSQQTVNPRPGETRKMRTMRRAPRIGLYVPPHLKKRNVNEQSEETKAKETQLDVKQPELRKPKKTRPQKEQATRPLFKFEYTDESGDVRSIIVNEDDNAEDLAETFGNQLGLTKPLRKALQMRLQQEIMSCYDTQD